MQGMAITILDYRNHRSPAHLLSPLPEQALGKGTVTDIAVV